MTALLSSVLDDQDKIKYYMAECKKMGIPIMPPDINLSGVNFTADINNNSIRFGLAATKNVGVQAVNEIIRDYFPRLTKEAILSSKIIF